MLPHPRLNAAFNIASLCPWLEVPQLVFTISPAVQAVEAVWIISPQALKRLDISPTYCWYP